jgi:hypothetical protein
MPLYTRYVGGTWADRPFKNHVAVAAPARHYNGSIDPILDGFFHCEGPDLVQSLAADCKWLFDTLFELLLG